METVASQQPGPDYEALGDIDVAELRRDFPIFSSTGTKPFHFLDSAASSQRPRQVLEAMDEYYEKHHSNVHRGVYALAEEATARYEGARRRIGRFIGTSDPGEIIFTKNATEGLNLVANSLCRGYLKAGDKVVLTTIEHHANLVPWLIMKDLIGIELTYIEQDENGYLRLDDLEEKVAGAKVVSATLASNVLGTLTPIATLAEAAHAAGAIMVADGAQYVPHIQLDVKSLGVDLMAFTGHKMLGPTGIGVLWGRRDLLDKMPPFMGGGDMITDVRLDGFIPAGLPYKFEAGTPPIAEAIGLAAAMDYLEGVGMQRIRNHEIALTAYALSRLQEAFGDDLHIHGPQNAHARGGVISFTYRDVHAHDMSQVLDTFGVAVRAGHHCAKPLMRLLGVPATARASFSVYNDQADVDVLVEALSRADALFG